MSPPGSAAMKECVFSDASKGSWVRLRFARLGCDVPDAVPAIAWLRTPTDVSVAS